MTSEGTQQGSGGAPRGVARLEVEFLDEAARRRVEQVIENILNEELSKQPLPESVRDEYDDVIWGIQQ